MRSNPETKPQFHLGLRAGELNLICNDPLGSFVHLHRMSLDSQSTMAFGRRGTSVQPPAPAPAPQTQEPSRAPTWLVAAAWEACLLALVIGVLAWALPQKVAIETADANATQRVIMIVNQSVTHLRRTVAAAEFPQGWFDPGAIRPDFARADVRQTQDLLYERYTYVTSTLNPTEMFFGSELEFNSMTKYFYVDRTLPKKRLTEEEMLEINGLYRTIARSNEAMSRWWNALGVFVTLNLVLAAAPLLLVRRRLELV